MTETTLIALPYSPWSEKARWALQASGVPFHEQHYQPLIGELALRRLTGQWSGPASVPVLVTGDGAVADSAAIARWADKQHVLFPAGQDAEVQRWIDVGERALAAGRVLALTQQLQDRAALLELVPRKLRGLLGPLAPGVAAFGVKRTLRKYAATTTGDVGAQWDAALDELRAGIAAGHGPARTLLAQFSFGDIAASQALGFVAPVSSRHVRMGAGSRAAFTNPARAEKYADLLAWRDGVYAAFREAGLSGE